MPHMQAGRRRLNSSTTNYTKHATCSDSIAQPDFASIPLLAQNSRVQLPIALTHLAWNALTRWSA